MKFEMPFDTVTMIVVLALFAPLLVTWIVYEIGNIRRRQRWARNSEAMSEGKASQTTDR